MHVMQYTLKEVSPIYMPLRISLNQNLNSEVKVNISSTLGAERLQRVVGQSSLIRALLPLKNFQVLEEGTPRDFSSFFRTHVSPKQWRSEKGK